MRGFRVVIAASGFAGALLLGAPSHAGEWQSGWWPVDEGPTFAWGSNRAFWWSDLGPTPYWGGTSNDVGLGLPYSAWYGPTSTYTYRVWPASTNDAAPPGQVVAGRVGMHCSTPMKTCVLSRASSIGAGCFCKVPGGPARGSVRP